MFGGRAHRSFSDIVATPIPWFRTLVGVADSSAQATDAAPLVASQFCAFLAIGTAWP